MPKINDPIIRAKLCTKLVDGGVGLNGTVLIKELTVASVRGRIDVVVIGDLMHGYEIKSDVDKLDRLLSESIGYAMIMDLLTAVVTEKHLKGASKLLPPYWGLMVFEADGHLKELRKAQLHTEQDLESMVGLLWKPEALELLKECGVTTGMKTKAKRQIRERLLPLCTMDQVRRALREQYRRHRSL